MAGVDRLFGTDGVRGRAGAELTPEQRDFTCEITADLKGKYASSIMGAAAGLIAGAWAAWLYVRAASGASEGEAGSFTPLAFLVAACLAAFSFGCGGAEPEAEVSPIREAGAGFYTIGEPLEVLVDVETPSRSALADRTHLSLMETVSANLAMVILTGLFCLFGWWLLVSRVRRRWQGLRRQAEAPPAEAPASTGTRTSWRGPAQSGLSRAA